MFKCPRGHLLDESIVGSEGTFECRECNKEQPGQIAGTPAAPVDDICEHDEDCSCYGDFDAKGNAVEHSMDCKNCTCEKPSSIAPADLSCLLCGHVKDKAVIHSPSGQYVCFDCRDAAMMGTRAEALLKDAEAYIRGYGIGSDSNKLANAHYIVRRLKGVTK